MAYYGGFGGVYDIYGKALSNSFKVQPTQQPAAYQGAKTKKSWSWMSTGCSIFSMLCCGACFLSPVFGMCGLIFSLTAYSDHKAGDSDRSKYKKKWAWGCVILAIVMGLVMIIGVVVAGSLLKDELMDFFGDLQDQINDMMNGSSEGSTGAPDETTVGMTSMAGTTVVETTEPPMETTTTTNT